MLLACLLGADSISFDKNYPRPNPGGNEKQIGGKGTITIDPANELEKAVFCSSFLSTGQNSEIRAKVEKQSWSAILELPEGEYEVWVELYTRNKKTGAVTLIKTKPVKIKLTKPLKT